jgi:hypothetical protein
MVVSKKKNFPASAAPDIIYMIRHGEKPVSDKVPPLGVDSGGRPSIHSLIPTGWARAGALATLFGPHGPAWIRTPDRLRSPSYGKPAESASHRAYQTISKLAQKLNMQIASLHPVGKEDRAMEEVLSSGPGVVLICWEHAGILDLAAAMPLAAGSDVPTHWPDDRFDVIWQFTAHKQVDGSVIYSFQQIAQNLLGGDQNSVIASTPDKSSPEIS